jgi:hypothetical protein
MDTRHHLALRVGLVLHLIGTFQISFKFRETPAHKLTCSMEDPTPILQGEESTMRRKNTQFSTIEPQRWAGEHTLAIVHHLNERCLALLAKQAHEDEALSALWARADDRVYERAGRCPVLLMDLHFHRADWWQRTSQKGGSSRPLEVPHSLVTEPAASLLREILMQTWTIGRTMPRALNLLFGMASEVTETITEMGPLEIDRIANEEARHLKARWPESRSFWKGLLEAAIGTDDHALGKIHLHCLQLLGSEFMVTPA